MTRRRARLVTLGLLTANALFPLASLIKAANYLGVLRTSPAWWPLVPALGLIPWQFAVRHLFQQWALLGVAALTLLTSLLGYGPAWWRPHELGVALSFALIPWWQLGLGQLLLVSFFLYWRQRQHRLGRT